MTSFFAPTAGVREKWYYIPAVVVGALFFWVITGGILGGIASTVLPTGVWSEQIAAFITFIPLVVASLTVPKIYGRNVWSIVTSAKSLRWDLIFRGFSWWLALLGASALISFALEPSHFTWTFDPIPFLSSLVVCLLFLPIQVAAEELYFRGVIPQALGRLFRSGLPVIALSSGLFAFLHLGNPETQADPLFAFIAFLVIATTWATATYQSNGLELAFGAHLANNTFGLLLVGYVNSSVPSAALWTTPTPDMKLTAINGVVIAAAWWWLTRRSTND